MTTLIYNQENEKEDEKEEAEKEGEGNRKQALGSTEYLLGAKQIQPE